MLTKIYDGITNPTAIDNSILFREADMIFMEAVDLPIDEGYELAASLKIILVDTPNRINTVKEVPLDVDIFDTGAVVRVPNEYSNARYDLQLCLATAYPIRLKIFVIATDCNLQTICDKVDFGNTLLTALSLRQLVADVAALAQAISLVVRLAQGDLTALPGLINLILPAIPDTFLPPGIPGGDPILIPGIPGGLPLPALPPVFDPTNIFN